MGRASELFGDMMESCVEPDIITYSTQYTAATGGSVSGDSERRAQAMQLYF